ncbi:MAG: heme o synthase [Patescibacteria group bacterium]
MAPTIAAYYQLTKPGIIRGNAVHVVAGGLFASTMGIDWSALAGVLFGTSLVIASACVANNYMDRGIDAKMKRTSKRPSVTGVVPFKSAMVFSAVLLILGIATLSVLTNLTVIAIGLIAYVLYVFAYGWAKRHTIHSTLVGAIPGALPAMAGYVAVDGVLSWAAVLIFLVVFAWQMPHFYAISLFRKKEYQAAKIPVLGAVRPFAQVRRVMLTYMMAYLATIIALISLDVVGPPAGLLLLSGAAYWLIIFMRTSTRDEAKWARSIFGSSLILTLVLLVASILNVFIPPFS